jgi:hypothetical protein
MKKIAVIILLLLPATLSASSPLRRAGSTTTVNIRGAKSITQLREIVDSARVELTPALLNKAAGNGAILAQVLLKTKNAARNPDIIQLFGYIYAQGADLAIAGIPQLLAQPENQLFVRISAVSRDRAFAEAERIIAQEFPGYVAAVVPGIQPQIQRPQPAPVNPGPVPAPAPEPVAGRSNGQQQNPGPLVPAPEAPIAGQPASAVNPQADPVQNVPAGVEPVQASPVGAVQNPGDQLPQGPSSSSIFSPKNVILGIAALGLGYWIFEKVRKKNTSQVTETEDTGS